MSLRGKLFVSFSELRKGHGSRSRLVGGRNRMCGSAEERKGVGAQKGCVRGQREGTSELGRTSHEGIRTPA